MENKIEHIYRIFLANPRVTTDSRKVTPQSIFFALKGDSFDGNEFAERALDAGAACAIVDNPAFAVRESCILVENVLKTLQELARYHRMHYSIPVIGITGTNGKTTTKELIHTVLSKRFRTLATQGNLNNHIGVPLTLLTIAQETEVAVIEMGANHPGEIGFLCGLAMPDYGLITNIGRAHLEGFGSFEGVIQTKTELYQYIRPHNGLIFLNSDDPLLNAHADRLARATYGAPPSDLAVSRVTSDPCVSVDMVMKDGTRVTASSQLFGQHNAANILAAACIGQHFGIPASNIRAAIEDYTPGNNRSQIKKTDHNLLILDAYNANPSSMKVALDAFAGTDFPDKTVILGDMLELGKESDHEHLAILVQLRTYNFGKVFLVGPEFTRLNTDRENICFHDSSLAAMWLEHHRISNSAILIKGSRGIRLEKILDVL